MINEYNKVYEPKKLKQTQIDFFSDEPIFNYNNEHFKEFEEAERIAELTGQDPHDILQKERGKTFG